MTAAGEQRRKCGRRRRAQTRLAILGWLNGQDRRLRSIFFLRSAFLEAPTVRRVPRSQDVGSKAGQRPVKKRLAANT